MTVLGAINKEAYGFSTFYANLVGEIRMLTEPENWFWVPSASNPSDLITRGASPGDLNKNSFWQTGQDWLWLPASEWPISKEVSVKSKTDVLGMQRKAFSQVITRSQARKDRNDALVGGKLTEAQLKSLGECLIFTNFSSFSKLLYAVAAVQFLSNA